MYVFYYNKSENLNLSNEQLDYLIKNSDLKQVDNIRWSSLKLAFLHNKSENLNLSEEQFDYLIHRSDLKQIDNYGCSDLVYALAINKKQNLNLIYEQWQYMIKNSDLSLIKAEEDLIELKKIQSELLNNRILNKSDIKKDIHKKVKI